MNKNINLDFIEYKKLLFRGKYCSKSQTNLNCY